MTVKNTPEERQLLNLIEKMPVADEDKKQWIDTIHNTGLNEDLAEIMREKLAAAPDDNPSKTLTIVKLARLVKRWRLVTQKKQFGR